MDGSNLELGARRSGTLGFNDLDAWKTSVLVAKEVYLLTKSFPKEEMFAITNQIKRASTSVSANIAEGFGRQTVKDKINFYHIAYGSLLETKNFIYLAIELEFTNQDETVKLLETITVCQKLINGLIRSSKERL
jgi:four helix bundle protein